MRLPQPRNGSHSPPLLQRLLPSSFPLITGFGGAGSGEAAGVDEGGVGEGLVLVEILEFYRGGGKGIAIEVLG